MNVRQPGAFWRFGHRLKWRVGWVLFAFGLAFGATFWYRKAVYAFLLAPADGQLSPFGGAPVFTAVQDMFGITVWIAMRAGILAALPVATYGAYSLVSPILSPSQRWTLRIFLPAPLVLFLAGAAFVYYVMLPVGLKFLLHFGEGVAVPLITLRQYLDLLTALMVALGIVFELPLMMFLLAKIKIVPYRKFKRLRKFVPFIALILGVLLTPGTDLISMVLVAAPITVLYEFGLFLAWLAHPEAGNYMWLRSIWSAVTSPARLTRWAYRKVRRNVRG